MPLHLLSTKLSIPPLRSKFVRRTRLIQKLNQGLEYGLILVSAPAGYGKSTLLSAWLSQVDTPATWLTLDEGDNDPSRFIAYLAAALATIDPSLENIITSSQNFRVQPDIDQLLITQINHLSQLKRPFYLVLDDYHLIQDQTVHQVANFLLDHRPNSMHLVIATRADPPLHLSKLRACSELLELRLTDLRFTNLEAADFLNHTMGVQVSPEDVARITARTEGWIAGLQIAALSMQKTEDISGFIASLAGSDFYIFDYLVEETLARQSTEIRTFLLYTSILDQFTPSLCDALLAADVEPTLSRPSADILRELLDKNLFIIPLDQDRLWFRYHHLFLDLLRVILEETSRGHSAELHRRAAFWYETQGLLPAALQHAISSGDMQLVAQIVSANVLVLLENDEVIPTLQKIDTLPQNDMIALPWLGIARAWIMGASQIERSLRLLDDVEKGVKDCPDGKERQRLNGHIAAARAFLFNAQGDTTSIISNAQRADELLPAEDIAVRAMNLNIWASGYSFNIKGYSVAIPIIEKALALALKARKPHVAMIAATHLASCQQQMGDLHACHRTCLEALAVADDFEKQSKHRLSAAGQIYSLMARNLAEWGESEKAIHFAQKGLQLSEQWGLLVAITGSLDCLGRILVFCQKQEQVRPIFQRSDDLAQKISPRYWQETALYNLETMLYCDGFDDDISHLLHRLQESNAQFSPILNAKLLIRNKQPDEALSLLEGVLSDLSGFSSFKTVRIHTLRAIAYQALRDEKHALDALRQALELGETENRVATFVSEGDEMEKLLRLAQPKTTTPKFVQQLLQAFESRHIIKPQPDIVREALIEPLSEREMDILKLLAQGCSDRVIAKTLVIAPDTVHKHLQKIYSKLDVHTRMEAILRARDLGLL